MPKEEKSAANIAQTVVENLGGVFRHLFPGVLIVGGAYVAHPHWFCQIDVNTWEHVVVLGAVALTVGNCWFVVNRYIVHQAIDILLYVGGIGIPKIDGCYHEDLRTFVRDSLCLSIVPRARKSVDFRASSVLLLYTLGEVGILFSWCPEPCSFIQYHRCPIQVVSVLVFLGGLWQDVLTEAIDRAVVEQAQKNRDQSYYY